MGLNNNIGKTFHIGYNLPSDRYDLYLLDKTDSGKFYGALTYTGYNEGSYLLPTVSLEREDAQKLMNSLWDAGIRPREMGTAGQLAAVSYHLEDMRKLVFDNERSSIKTITR